MFNRKYLLSFVLTLTACLLISQVAMPSISVNAGQDPYGPEQPEKPAAVGPDKFPVGYNPLTGLPVEDPALLELPPALVSVTNFPVSARPQAGLSTSPYVFEMYIGKGMTRLLAMFYGSYPEIAGSGSAGVRTDNAGIGPIRSGRLPYEKIRKLYSATLIMAGASSEVGAQLNSSSTIFGSDRDDINSAMIDVTRLEKIAETNRARMSAPLNLTGNRFTTAVPAGGKGAGRLWVFYNFYNQIEWKYDQAEGAYLRAQDKADGSGKFYPSTDRLTGEQLAFENVVVLFAEHTVRTPTIIDINLLYTTRPALLFRDGKVYKLFWTTMNGDYEKTTGRLRPLRFVDADGQAFPLKPGQTWVEIVTPAATAQEIEAGDWKVRFYAP